MRKSNKRREVLINDNFFHLPEVKHTEDKYKAKGLSMMVYLFYRLPDCKNCIGKFSNISDIAERVGVKKHTLADMIRGSEAFCYDEQRGLFWAPRIRKMCGLDICPSSEELDDIACNGNVFFGHARREDAKPAVKDKEAEPETREKASGMAVGKADQTKVIRKSSSSHLANQKGQSADNQAKDNLHRYRDRNRNISNRNINIEAYKAERKQVSSCHDDDDDEDFVKNLSLKQWRNSVSKRNAVNLCDDATLCCFAEWMRDYCMSMCKKMGSAAECRKYAANLLRKNTKTRAEFDNYLASRTKMRETEELRPEVKSEYEHIISGIRFSIYGLPLPYDAPPTPSDQVMYSYINNCFVPKSKYDPNRENKALNIKSRDMSIFMGKGGELC